MPTVDSGEWRCVMCGRAFADRAAGSLCPHDDAVLVPTPTAERFGGDALLGRRLAGDYLIFDILGLGGFGAVYRAVDVAHGGRHVAIKTIRPGAERHNADARARFAQEARLLERLRNEHIVRVFHYGEADDALFMALELVPGRSLKRILRSRRSVSPRRAVSITAQILDALAHAHALGLIHRDLKPANILVIEHEDDAVKVIDFGIAKVLEAEDDDEGPKTGTGLVLGTVRYMAPEQLRQGGVVGPATDLYAVGIMFYEMLVGEAPFDGSQAEIAAAHLYQPAPAVPEDRAPASLRGWVQRVLRKNPEERYASAIEMRAALIEALPGAVVEAAGLDDESTAATPVLRADEAADDPDAVDRSDTPPVESESPRQPDAGGPPTDGASGPDALGEGTPSGSLDGLSGPSSALSGSVVEAARRAGESIETEGEASSVGAPGQDAAARDATRALVAKTGPMPSVDPLDAIPPIEGDESAEAEGATLTVDTDGYDPAFEVYDPDAPKPTMQSLPAIPVWVGPPSKDDAEAEALGARLAGDAGDADADADDDTPAPERREDPGSTLPDGAKQATTPSPAVPPGEAGPTRETPHLDPDVAALPSLAPGPRDAPDWGDVDDSAPASTIAAARGELSVEREERVFRAWWLAPLVALAAAAVLWVWAPWQPADDGGEEVAERISLSVGNTPRARAADSGRKPLIAAVDAGADAQPDADTPADAAPADAAIAPDVGPDATAERPAPAAPGMGWRTIKRYEDPVLGALAVCHCTRAGRLVSELPRAFPRDRKRRLQRKVRGCKQPLVDERCVDGEVVK